jgi:Domain of unknown function (DUF4396)
MVLGTTLRLGNWTTVGLSVALAFLFGYSLTMLPLLRAGLALKTATALAFASDTASIALMEIVDTSSCCTSPGRWTRVSRGSLVASLIVAGIAAFPLNRWLVSRGMGHAVLHAYHR